jgi:hypothetical protein
LRQKPNQQEMVSALFACFAERMLIIVWWLYDCCRYLYNDASVKEIKESEVCNNSAYVLFYHKVLSGARNPAFLRLSIFLIFFSYTFDGADDPFLSGGDARESSERLR